MNWEKIRKEVNIANQIKTAMLIAVNTSFDKLFEQNSCDCYCNTDKHNRFTNIQYVDNIKPGVCYDHYDKFLCTTIQYVTNKLRFATIINDEFKMQQSSVDLLVTQLREYIDNNTGDNNIRCVYSGVREIEIYDGYCTLEIIIGLPMKENKKEK
jgi:hypothetical protein